MPIKNPFKKTFAQKRKALGIEREKGTSRIYSFGAITNPKLRKVYSKYEADKSKLTNKLDKLKSYKPKNELDARKQKDSVLALKNKLTSLESNMKAKFFEINKIRNSDRRDRQGTLILDKLYPLLNASDKKAFVSKLSLSFIGPINSKLLRENYKNFLNSKKKSFVDITSKEALTLLVSAINKFSK